MRAGKGRPVALVVLFTLSLLNLSSEVSSRTSRATFVSTVDEMIRHTFGVPRQLLFDHY